MAKRVDWYKFFGGGRLGYGSDQESGGKLARYIEPGQQYDPNKYEAIDTSTPEYQYRAAANREYAWQARQAEAERQAEAARKAEEERAWRLEYLRPFSGDLTNEQVQSLLSYPIKVNNPVRREEFIGLVKKLAPGYLDANQRREKTLGSVNDALKSYYMMAREGAAMQGLDPNSVKIPEYGRLNYWNSPKAQKPVSLEESLAADLPYVPKQTMPEPQPGKPGNGVSPYYLWR